MAENVREIVLDILLSIEREEQYSNQLIRAVLDKYDYLDNREKAFIKRVSEGTIERKIELDYYLNRFSSVPVKKMKPLIRCLLRMSVYQIIYMDSVPDSAVCNEACKLAVKRKFVNLKGFVNGVLRSIAREKEHLDLPDRKKNPYEYLSVKYSMPEWIVKLWVGEYGAEKTETILEGLLKIHPVSIRFRTDLEQARKEELLEKLAAVGAKVTQSPYLDFCYLLEHVDNVRNLPGFEEGEWTIQDVSSALAVEAAGIKKGDFVIDVCAAPGGKTALACEHAGKVLGRDVSEEKVELLEDTLNRMGCTNVRTEVWDATVADERLFGQADVVLMDVPCSGLGILGKKRDIKYHVTPERLKELEILQKQIVTTCVNYVKPGGTVLYSTCTIRREENEYMVQYLIEELGLEPVPLSEALPGMSEVLAGANHVQLLPGYAESDGFFIAKLRKRNQ